MRALVTVGNPEALARQVVKRGLSVRQTEQLARRRHQSASAGGTSRRPGEGCRYRARWRRI